MSRSATSSLIISLVLLVAASCGQPPLAAEPALAHTATHEVVEATETMPAPTLTSTVSPTKLQTATPKPPPNHHAGITSNFPLATEAGQGLTAMEEELDNEIPRELECPELMPKY